MYPLVKLTTTLFKAKKRAPLTIYDESIIECRAGLTDIDMFMELNNARFFNYMELGRWDFSQRIGFIKTLRSKKWGVAVGGASIRYRRRIPFLKKFTLSSKIVCHDSRWLYFLQETHRNGKICSSALMKVCVTCKDGLVPIDQVMDAYGEKDFHPNVPDWVQAWIDAEGMRPWPSDNKLVDSSANEINSKAA